MKDKIADILKSYTSKHGIMASSVILESYADELVKNGCIIVYDVSERSVENAT